MVRGRIIVGDQPRIVVTRAGSMLLNLSVAEARSVVSDKTVNENVRDVISGLLGQLS